MDSKCWGIVTFGSKQQIRRQTPLGPTTPRATQSTNLPSADETFRYRQRLIPRPETPRTKHLFVASSRPLAAPGGKLRPRFQSLPGLPKSALRPRLPANLRPAKAMQLCASCILSHSSVPWSKRTTRRSQFAAFHPSGRLLWLHFSPTARITFF